MKSYLPITTLEDKAFEGKLTRNEVYDISAMVLKDIAELQEEIRRLNLYLEGLDQIFPMNTIAALASNDLKNQRREDDRQEYEENGCIY